MKKVKRARVNNEKRVWDVVEIKDGFAKLKIDTAKIIKGKLVMVPSYRRVAESKLSLG